MAVQFIYISEARATRFDSTRLRPIGHKEMCYSTASRYTTVQLTTNVICYIAKKKSFASYCSFCQKKNNNNKKKEGNGSGRSCIFLLCSNRLFNWEHRTRTVLPNLIIIIIKSSLHVSSNFLCSTFSSSLWSSSSSHHYTQLSFYFGLLLLPTVTASLSCRK